MNLLLFFLAAPTSLAQELVAEAGAWRTFRVRDPITDDVRLSAVTETDEGALSLTCYGDGNLQLLVVFRGSYLGPEDSKNVVFRVDDAEPTTASWRHTFTGDLSRVSLRLYGRAIVEQFQRGSTVHVRSWAPSEMPVTLSFNLAGFTAATRPVLEACPLDATRNSRVSQNLGDPIAGTGTTDDSAIVLFEIPFQSQNDAMETREGPEQVQLLRQTSDFYLVEFADGAIAWVLRSQLTDVVEKESSR